MNNDIENLGIVVDEKMRSNSATSTGKEARPKAQQSLEKLAPPASSREVIAAIHAQVDAHMLPLLDKTDRAAIEVEKTKLALDKNQQEAAEWFRQLKDFCKNHLPKMIQQNLEDCARVDLQKIVDGVDFSVMNGELEKITDTLKTIQIEAENSRRQVSNIDSFLRYFGGQLLTGITIAVAGSFSIFYLLFGTLDLKEVKQLAEIGKLATMVQSSRTLLKSIKH